MATPPPAFPRGESTHDAGRDAFTGSHGTLGYSAGTVPQPRSESFFLNIAPQKTYAPFWSLPYNVPLSLHDSDDRTYLKHGILGMYSVTAQLQRARALREEATDRAIRYALLFLHVNRVVNAIQFTGLPSARVLASTDIKRLVKWWSDHRPHSLEELEMARQKDPVLAADAKAHLNAESVAKALKPSDAACWSSLQRKLTEDNEIPFFAVIFAIAVVWTVALVLVMSTVNLGAATIWIVGFGSQLPLAGGLLFVVYHLLRVQTLAASNERDLQAFLKTLASQIPASATQQESDFTVMPQPAPREAPVAVRDDYNTSGAQGISFDISVPTNSGPSEAQLTVPPKFFESSVVTFAVHCQDSSGFQLRDVVHWNTAAHTATELKKSDVINRPFEDIVEESSFPALQSLMQDFASANSKKRECAETALKLYRTTLLLTVYKASVHTESGERASVLVFVGRPAKEDEVKALQLVHGFRDTVLQAQVRSVELALNDHFTEAQMAARVENPSTLAVDRACFEPFFQFLSNQMTWGALQKSIHAVPSWVTVSVADMERKLNESELFVTLDAHKRIKCHPKLEQVVLIVGKVLNAGRDSALETRIPVTINTSHTLFCATFHVRSSAEIYREKILNRAEVKELQECSGCAVLYVSDESQIDREPSQEMNSIASQPPLARRTTALVRVFAPCRTDSRSENIKYQASPQRKPVPGHPLGGGQPLVVAFIAPKDLPMRDKRLASLKKLCEDSQAVCIERDTIEELKKLLAEKYRPFVVLLAQPESQISEYRRLAVGASNQVREYSSSDFGNDAKWHVIVTFKESKTELGELKERDAPNSAARGGIATLVNSDDSDYAEAYVADNGTAFHRDWLCHWPLKSTAFDRIVRVARDLEAIRAEEEKRTRDTDARDKEMNHHAYEFIEEIGRGAYGIVKLCKLGEALVAVKEVEIKSSDPILRQKAEAEAAVLSTLSAAYKRSRDVNGQFVVQMLQTNMSADRRTVVLEYCQHSIGDFVKNMPPAFFMRDSAEEMQIVKKLVAIAYQLTAGLKFIHDNGFVHYDIKEDNLRICEKSGSERYPPLNQSWALRIIDFGEALRERDLLGGDRGTLSHVAPECWIESQGRKASSKSDIFAMGVTLMILFRWTPEKYLVDDKLLQFCYPNYHKEHALDDKVRDVAGQQQRHSTLPPSSELAKVRDKLLEFVRFCLKPDPAQRLSAEMLLNHSLMKWIREQAPAAATAPAPAVPVAVPANVFPRPEPVARAAAADPPLGDDEDEWSDG